MFSTPLVSKLKFKIKTLLKRFNLAPTFDLNVWALDLRNFLFSSGYDGLANK